MQDEASDLMNRLDALSERVKEARAAAEVIAAGDMTATQDLDREIDGMAQDIAALKGITAQTRP